MKKGLLLLMVLLSSTVFVNAQATYFVSGSFANPNTWSPSGSQGQMTATGFGSTYQMVTNGDATGVQYFRFYSGSGASGSNYGPGSSTTISTNTVTTSSSGNGSQAYGVNVTNTSDKMIFNVGPGAPGTASFVIFDLAATPVTVSTVAQSPTSSLVNSGQNVLVTATLSGSLPTGQAVYLRYAIGGAWSSASILTMTGSGTTYTATIPSTANTASAAIAYYVVTSSTTTPTNSNIDLCTINGNNNSGNNYTYTVGASTTTYAYNSTGTGIVGTPNLWSATTTWVGGVIPPATATVNIVSGDYVSINNAITQTGGTTNVNGTAFLIDKTTSGSNVYGTLTIGAQATFEMNGTAVAIPTATWTAGTPGATLLLAQTTANTITGLNQGFKNITVNFTGSNDMSAGGGLSTATNANFTCTNLTIQGTGSSKLFKFTSSGSSNTVTIGGNLVVNGGTFTPTSGSGDVTLNVSGNLSVTAGTATLNETTTTITGSATFSGGTVLIGNVANSTFTINGDMTVSGAAVSNTTGGTTTYNINGTYASTSGSFYLSSGSYTNSTSNTGIVVFNIAGDMTLSGGTFTSSGGGSSTNLCTINVNGTNSSSQGGKLTLSGGIFTNPNTSPFTIFTASDFIMNNSSSSFISSSTSSSSNRPYALNVGGNFNMTAGTLTGGYTASNQQLTITFTGGSNNSVTYTQSGGSITSSRPIHFTVASPKVLTLNNDITMQTATAVGTFTVNSGATLNCTTNSVLGGSAGSFVLSAGGTLKIGSSAGITSSGATGNIQTNTRSFDNTATTTYVYSGSGNQATGSGLPNAIGNLTIANTGSSGSNVVTLSQATSVSTTGVVTLTSGLLNTATNLLTLSNTGTGAITGGSTTCFVQGPLAWTLPALSATGSYTYPIGVSTTYYPITLSNITSAASTVVKEQAFATGAAGTADGSTLGSISTTEYWQQTVSAGTFTSANITITRQIGPSGVNAVANSTTNAASSYSSLGGSVFGSAYTTAGPSTSVCAAGSQYFTFGTLVVVSPPTIGSFVVSSPGSSTSGYVGNTVTVTGTNLGSVYTVKVGGVSGTSVSIVSQNSTTLTFYAPNVSGQIYVINSGGNVTSTGSYTNLGYITAIGATDWNTAASWYGTSGIPVAGATVTIANNLSVNAAVSNAPNTVTINGSTGLTFGGSGALTINNTLTNGGTLTLVSGAALTMGASATLTNNSSIVMSSGGTITLGAGATLANSTNTFTYGSGSVVFSGAGTVTGTITFNNLKLNGATTNSSTVTVNGTLTINNTAVTLSQALTYGGSSSLYYSSGSTFTVANEWTGNGTTAGTGIPAAVYITGNTTVNMPITNRGIAGLLNVASGSNLTLNATSGDLYLTGNMTLATSSCITATSTNGRAVFFAGSGTQVLTATATGTVALAYVFVNNTATLQLGTGTNLTISGNGGNGGLQISSSATPAIDLNGNTLTMSGGGNLYLGTGSGNKTINATGNGIFAVTTNAVTVATGGTTTLSFGSTVTVSLSNGMNFGVGLTTIYGTLQISSTSAIVNTNAPYYANGSYLTYNITPSGSTFARGTEWGFAGAGTVGSSAGYPYHVTITNSTIINYNSASTAKALAGNLKIDAGAALYMDYGTPNTTTALTVAGNITVNGNLSLGDGSGGDLNLGGSFTVASTSGMNYNGRAVNFTGSGTQVLTYTGSGTIDFTGTGTGNNSSGTSKAAYFVLNNTGSVQLNNTAGSLTSITITQVTGNALQLLNTGNLDLNGQTLNLTGSGGNIYVNGTNRLITSSVAGGSIAVGGTKYVANSSGTGSLIFDVNVTVNLNTNGIFGFGKSSGVYISTLKGTLSINSATSCYVNNDPPIYYTSSNLEYNTGANYNVSNEWFSNTSSGAGVPYNVYLGNVTASSSLNFGAASTYYQCNGSITIASGSTLALGTNPGGDLYVGGDFEVDGTYTPNNRGVFFVAPSGLQNIKAASSPLTIPYLFFGTSSGAHTVVLNNTDVLATASNGGGTALSFNSSTDILDLNGHNLTIGTVSPSPLTCNFAGGGTIKGNSGSNIIIQGSSSSGSIGFTTGSQTLNNLTVNLSSGGITLASPLTVGTLTLNAGTITLGANNLTVNSGSIAGSPGSSNYIVTNSTGGLGLQVPTATNTTITYPIGPSTAAYNPVSLNNHAGSGGSQTFYTSVAATAPVSPGNDNTKYYVKDIWTITGGLSSANASELVVTPQWNSSDQESSYSTTTNSYIAIYSGGWNPIATTAVTTVGANSYTSNSSVFNYNYSSGLVCAVGNFPNTVTVSTAGISGLAANPLIAQSTNQAIIGFSTSISAGSSNFSQLVLSAGTGGGDFSSFSSISLVSCTSATYSLGSSTNIVTIPSPSGSSITFSGFSQPINTTNTYYFIVGTIVSTVTNGTASITPQFVSSNVSVSGGAVVSGSPTGSSYTFSGYGTLDHFTISTISSYVAGNSFIATITAKDVLNNTVGSYTGTPAMTTTSGAAVSPTTTAAFTAGVLSGASFTVNTAGIQTLIATDTKTGSSNSFTVSPAVLNNFLVEATGGGTIATQTAGSSFNFYKSIRNAP